MITLLPMMERMLDRKLFEGSNSLSLRNVEKTTLHDRLHAHRIHKNDPKRCYELQYRVVPKIRKDRTAQDMYNSDQQSSVPTHGIVTLP